MSRRNPIGWNDSENEALASIVENLKRNRALQLTKHATATSSSSRA